MQFVRQQQLTKEYREESGENHLKTESWLH